MDQVADDVLRELADLVRRVAEASGRPWVYGTVVINVGDELPRLQPVVVVSEGAKLTS